MPGRIVGRRLAGLLMGRVMDVFHELQPEAFPFLVELLDEVSGELRWSQNVTGPGGLRVPSKHQINDGRTLRVRITFGDGEVIEE